MATVMNEGQESKLNQENGLRNAYLELARELAPFSDSISIADGLEASSQWGIETFVKACEESGLDARAVFGQLPVLLKGTDWLLLEMNTGEWRVVRRLDDSTVALLPAGDEDQPKQLSVENLKHEITGHAARVKAPGTSADDENESQRHSPFAYHWFWKTVADYRGSFVYIGIAGLVANTLALAIPLFIMNVYDRVFPNQAFATLWVLAVGVIAAIGFDLCLRIARAALTDAIGEKVDNRLSTKLFEKIVDAPLAARREATGAYISRFNEFEFVRDFFTSTTLSAIVDLGFVFIFFIVIALVGGWLVLVPIFGFIAVLLVGLVLQHRVSKTITRVRRNAAGRHTLLFETISSLEVVKSIGAEQTLSHWWRGLTRAGAKSNEELRRLTTIAMSIAMSIQQCITIGLVISGAYLFAAGGISLGAIIAIVMLSSRALAPVSTIALLLSRGRQAFHSLAALDQLMMLPSESGTKSIGQRIERSALKLKNVGLRLEGAQENVLSDISLEISPGERVGIVGRVGCGKTSLCRLLAALYPPDEGVYAIDGLDVRQYNVHEIRKADRLVGSSTGLFSGTIRENLILSDPTVSNERLLEAARLAGLMDFITDGAAGFDRDIGERGSHLSSGQRRILSLARALVEPFKVLILDEPTSNLDSWTEARLIERLREAIKPDQTLIIATHRQPMLDLVDRLIVMERGRIVMDGPKEKVIEAMKHKGTIPAAAHMKKEGLESSNGPHIRRTSQGPRVALTSGHSIVSIPAKKAD